MSRAQMVISYKLYFAIEFLVGRLNAIFLIVLLLDQIKMSEVADSANFERRNY